MKLILLLSFLSRASFAITQIPIVSDYNTVKTSARLGEVVINCLVVGEKMIQACGAVDLILQKPDGSEKTFKLKGDVLKVTGLEKKKYTFKVKLKECSEFKILNGLEVGRIYDVHFNLPCGRK